MGTGSGRKGLQVFLVALGSVATIAGASTMLLGAESIVGVGAVTPSVDSEMRFYAVWYAAAGLVLLRAVPRVESEATTVRAVSGMLFIAGCVRLLSWLMVGKPSQVAIGLMFAELILPFVMVPWQASVARRRDKHYSSMP